VTSPDDQFCPALRAAFHAIDATVTDPQMELMFRHFQRMVETNRVMNLTRITDPREAAVKHYADSLAMLKLTDSRGWKVNRVLDIGTGAGFPAVPLAIVRPGWHITAIDGTKKKIDFVAQFAAEAGLSNFQCMHAHSEHWETSQRFDMVTGRALAKLPEFLRASARFVAPGGRVVVYKSDPLPVDETRETEQWLAAQIVSGAGVGQPMVREDAMPYVLDMGDERLSRALHVFWNSTASDKR